MALKDGAYYCNYSDALIDRRLFACFNMQEYLKRIGKLSFFVKIQLTFCQI